MKRSHVLSMVWSVSALTLLAPLPMPSVYADFTFGEPVKVPLPLGGEYIECFSADGLEVYISTLRSGGQGDWDLWVHKRASQDQEWGPAVNLGPSVNSPQGDFLSSISTDGLSLYFCSWRGGSSDNGHDLYVTTRKTKHDPWGPAVNLGPTINNPGRPDADPWISPDGLELYLGSYNGYGACDIWVTRRATEKDPWGSPVNIGPLVNSAYEETYLSLSPDGLLLLWSDCHDCGGRPPRPSGYGGDDMWMARRASIGAPWQEPVNLGPGVNGSGDEQQPRISPDGRTLYYWTSSASWQAPIIPICDFNGDDEIDGNDLQIMADHWGQDCPLCDVGPFPWGDGVVDEKDLAVLMEYVSSPAPHASGVPCDVTLSWLSASFALTCDVYFGTSLEAVRNASRVDPCGVLVSQGQTATTYDPAGFLECSKTYYWRVDLVSAEPNRTIYQGPVWPFTTKSAIHPIVNVTATASSFQAGTGPERTIDGSGLDANDLHSNQSKDMWWSKPGLPQWIQYEFDKVHRLHEMWVWNYNLAIEPAMGFGAKTVKVEYSTDGTTWTTLEGVPEFVRAPGQSGYAADTKVSFGDVSAKFVKLTIIDNWGVTQQTGLSEVRFYARSAAAGTEP